MRTSTRAACCACAVVIIAGCAGQGPTLAASHSTPSRIELDSTPFFPQRDYQCGPAALATILSASGLAVTSDELVAAIYLPGRRGSLQPEIVAATRARGRLPYRLPARAESLVAEVAAGRPVLVLQKQGAGPWPAWHYAVVIGYDLDRDTVLLRSGTDRRLEMSARRFSWTWDRADRWALVALTPGEMPAEPDLALYMEAAAGLEAVGQADAAAVSYEAAAGQWPTAALPWLGLANLAYAGSDYGTAEARYRQALRRDPGDVAARNNRAETLLKLGCVASAAREIAHARGLAAGTALAAAVADTATRIAAPQPIDAPGCPDAD